MGKWRYAVVPAMVALVLVACGRVLPTSTAQSSPSPIQNSSPSASPGLPLTVPATTLHAGEAGLAYSPVTMQAAGGSAPFSWSVGAGALPGGLTMSPNGVISGTPSAAGTFNFTVEVTDSSSATADGSESIVVEPRLAVPRFSLHLGEGGVVYKPVTVIATGGLIPYAWSVVAGSLPAGLSLSNTGVISGTPPNEMHSLGAFAFTLQVTDALSATATAKASLTVDDHVGISSAGGQQFGTCLVNPWSVQCQCVKDFIGFPFAYVSEGVAPYTVRWVPAASDMPPGTALKTWAISDPPGAYAVALVVTDSSKLTAALATAQDYHFDIQVIDVLGGTDTQPGSAGQHWVWYLSNGPSCPPIG